MHTELLRAKLRHTLMDFPEVVLVYLFGSQTRGNTGPQSDYDLGVLIDRGKSTDHIRDRFAHKVGRVLMTDRIDVVLLNRVSIELAYSVIAQGTVLYERDLATRIEYEAQVMSRYGDYLPVLRAQREDILRGDKHGARVQRYRETLGRTERALSKITAAQRQDTD